MEDENLCTHFHNNGSPESVPLAVKDKNELRRELKKRMRSNET
jgi:hypothetical protein